ncbi:MAG: hypothetical protein ACE5HI_12550 [bacterium]
MADNENPDLSKTQPYTSDELDKTQPYVSDSDKTRPYEQSHDFADATQPYETEGPALTDKTVAHNLGIGDVIELNDKAYEILKSFRATMLQGKPSFTKSRTIPTSYFH